MTILKLIITKFNNISYCHEENYIKIDQFISDTGRELQNRKNLYNST